MSQDAIQKLFHDKNELYALPQTLAEVLRITRDERSSADELADVLIKDPAMTARLLRVVNSPYYGGGREVSSMRQAVLMVGLRQVTALAVSTSVYAISDQWFKLIDRVRFWRHSLEVAIASRLIAEACGYENREEVFVSGLLHDIGLLLLCSSVTEQYSAVWSDAIRNGNLIDTEEEALGTNHARVGQFLLEQWQLPDAVCRSVGYHHTVFPPGEDDSDLIPVQIVALANHISKFHIAARGDVDASCDLETREIIRENLRIEPQKLTEIERKLFSLTVAESKFLEIDIGSPEDFLNEANQMLFEQYSAVEALLEENRRLQKQHAGDQVKRGYLESFRSTTSSFTQYLDQAVTSILKRSDDVLAAIASGAIVDPQGLVASSVESIISDMKTVSAVMREVRSLVGPEQVLDYDQHIVQKVEERIERELLALHETSAPLR